MDWTIVIIVLLQIPLVWFLYLAVRDTLRWRRGQDGE